MKIEQFIEIAQSLATSIIDSGLYEPESETTKQANSIIEYGFLPSFQKEETEFEKYKAIHTLCYPNDPLKSWINESNFENKYLESWDNIQEALSVIMNNDFFEKQDEEFDYMIDSIQSSFLDGDINLAFENVYSLTKWYKEKINNG